MVVIFIFNKKVASLLHSNPNPSNPSTGITEIPGELDICVGTDCSNLVFSIFGIWYSFGLCFSNILDCGNVDVLAVLSFTFKYEVCFRKPLYSDASEMIPIFLED